MPFQSCGHVGWMVQRFPLSHCSQEVPKHTSKNIIIYINYGSKITYKWQVLANVTEVLNIQEIFNKDFVDDITNLKLFLYLLANIWHVWLQHHWQKANNICAETNYSTSTAPVMNSKQQQDIWYHLILYSNDVSFGYPIYHVTDYMCGLLIFVILMNHDLMFGPYAWIVRR